MTTMQRRRSRDTIYAVRAVDSAGNLSAFSQIVAGRPRDTTIGVDSLGLQAYAADRNDNAEVVLFHSTCWLCRVPIRHVSKVE